MSNVIPFPVLPENFPLLARTARTGVLSYDIDWSGLPLAPDPKKQKPAHLLRAMERVTGVIENEFRLAAFSWLDEMPWDCTVQRVVSKPDIVLRFYALTESVDYSRMASSTLGKSPATIWIDTGATPWGIAPVNGFLASLFGRYRVPLYNALLHEIGHALGVDHSHRPDSVMYAPAYPGARPPADLHTRNLHHALPSADRAAFRAFCERHRAFCEASPP